ncbi:MAG TPA: CPBP family intramembrane glutamic endopeptidase [Candidatus Acidoferrales bacterium]|nr:CPBP family intramembrane glutamic endopeptidase [Candidatus Acidoferrales bacterium]
MLASIYFVAIMGVFLPALCIRSYYRLKAGARFPPKSALRKQTLVMHALMLLLAFFTWRTIGIGQYIFPRPAIGWKDVAAGLGVLLLFLAFMYPQWKNSALRKHEKTYRRMPTSSSELPMWFLVSLSAGIVEEIVYRGVLLQILWYWIGNWWVAVLLCALAFALGHSIQGLKNIFIVFFMSLIFHALVRFTGSLYIAMAVHATYDAIAGLAYLSFYKLTSEQPSPPATASVQ